MAYCEKGAGLRSGTLNTLNTMDLARHAMFSPEMTDADRVFAAQKTRDAAIAAQVTWGKHLQECGQCSVAEDEARKG